MSKINVLSFAVANLIAAGEVVDRPSSVIKELMENAIDAGATMITVEIQNGGITYMRVSDNGCGIEPEDLPVAIRRHATSKIKNAEDLDGILTLGFRGEALAAIASVSELRIISKTKNAPTGSVLKASAGNIIGVSERAAADGTTIIVEDLFANVPARRKFLKKDATEAMAVCAVVEKIALSKPDISFKLIVDGNTKLETIGDGNLKNTIYSVFGREFAAKLIETKISVDGILVEGFVGRSDNVRANRNYQNFFINGRYVKSKTACAALEQAYTSYIPPDKFPCCVLFMDINPSTVDVNVHPAKLEVKFSNEKPVFEAIYYAVKNALEQNVARPNVDLSPITQRAKVNEWIPKGVFATMPIEEGKKESIKTRQLEAGLYTAPKEPEIVPAAESAFSIADTSSVGKKAVDDTPISKSESIATAPQQIIDDDDDFDESIINTPGFKWTAEIYMKLCQKKYRTLPMVDENGQPIDYDDEDADFRDIQAENNSVQMADVDAAASAEPEVKSLDYRIIGEAFNAYVIVERGDTMLLVDKHAAHERIIFEQLKAGLKSMKVSSQILMLPLEIMMTSDEIQTLLDYKKEIEAIGFEFTVGKYTASITAIPEGIGTDAVSDMLVVMAERIKSGTGSANITRDIIFEKALYQASCKAAIKAGREYSHEHIKWIVGKLMELPDITVCPHGRPVAMELSRKNLDRQFERT